MTIDFRTIFEASPASYLILLPDAPRFTIVAVSDAYAAATNTVRDQILGKGLFEVFPDNPDDPKADGVRNLTASLLRAMDKKKMDIMAIQKYDIQREGTAGGGFEVRYWSPDNSPVVDADGIVVYLIHHVTDVTAEELLIQKYGDAQFSTEEFARQHSQLERLNKILVSREARMAGLKTEIRALKEKYGEE